MKNTQIQPKYKVGQIVKCWDGIDTVDRLLITEIDLNAKNEYGDYKGLYLVLNL